MFLFVSHARFKQTGLSSALLLLFLTAHADVSDVAEKPPGDTPPDTQLDAQSQHKPGQDTNVQNHQFPHWPHHMQGAKSIIPPPPPGPYKSSALNDYAVSAPVYRSAKQPPRRQAVRRDSASMPMDMFSPDIPWPTNLRPEQKMPEHRVSGSGQHYVRRPQISRPQAMLKQPGGPAVKPQYGHNYGRQQGAYPNAPYMNDMGMRSSRWMPNMSMAPPGPYNSRAYSNRWNYAPNFSPDYGSNYGVQRYDSRYARPVTNNRSLNLVNPAYR